MVAAFKERHKLVVGGLNALPGVKCLIAGGAFYAFPDMRDAIRHLHAIGKLKAPTDLELAEYLLEQAGVAVVPGSAFGAEGYVRLSFATSKANLQNALVRMAKALV
jgi:aspartate aminotransferase